MTYSQEWLEANTAIRKVFAILNRKNVISGQEERVYISNTPYNTNDGVYFNPIMGTNISLTENIPISDGSVSIATGTVELLNFSGEIDSWLDPTKYVWYNRDIKIFVGDPSWTVSTIDNFETGTTFKLVFKGLINDIDGNGTTSLGIKMRSYLDKLNGSISDQTLSKSADGGVSTIEDIDNRFAPIVLGEVFNIQPPLVEPGKLKYLIHKAGDPGSPYRKIASVIEIRDNGVPIYTEQTTAGGGIYDGWFYDLPSRRGTIDLVNGYIYLNTPAAGTITCSVQGDNRSIDLSTGNILDSSSSFSSNVVKIVATILLQYGNTRSRLTASDLDLSSFLSMDVSSNVGVGVYITNKDNLLQVLENVAKSANIRIITTGEGKVKLTKLGVYSTPNSVTSITSDDILQDSLVVAYRPPVIAAVKLGYCHNWAVQNNLLTSIPDEHKKLFDEAYEYCTVTDTSVATTYKLSIDATPSDTLLINKNEALSIASQILNYFKVPKTVYRFKGSTKLMSLVLGQSLTIKHHRYGMQNGVTGQVVSLTPNYSDFTIDIEVIV